MYNKALLTRECMSQVWILIMIFCTIAPHSNFKTACFIYSVVRRKSCPSQYFTICICACLHCCYNFNPCSCHLLPYVCMLWSWYHVCHCFKVMSLVEILLMQHKICIFIIIKNMKTLTFGQSVKNSAVHTNDIVCAKGQLCSCKRWGDNYGNLYVPNFVCTCEPIMNWSWCRVLNRFLSRRWSLIK